MFLRLIARLTGCKVVFLMDYDGEITRTLAKKTPFGYLARRYIFTGIHNVILREDGNVQNSFVTKWRDE